VRQPIYRGSIERWRKYEKHLEPLFAALINDSDSSSAAESQVEALSP
jgi:hypothetical protein